MISEETGKNSIKSLSVEEDKLVDEMAMPSDNCKKIAQGLSEGTA